MKRIIQILAILLMPTVAKAGAQTSCDVTVKLPNKELKKYNWNSSEGNWVIPTSNKWKCKLAPLITVNDPEADAMKGFNFSCSQAGGEEVFIPYVFKNATDVDLALTSKSKITSLNINCQ